MTPPEAIRGVCRLWQWGRLGSYKGGCGPITIPSVLRCSLGKIDLNVSGCQEFAAPEDPVIPRLFLLFLALRDSEQKAKTIIRQNELFRTRHLGIRGSRKSVVSQFEQTFLLKHPVWNP